MRTLHTLYLRNNGMNDSFYEELVYLVTHCKLQALDISENDISPKGIDGMLQQLKSGYGNFRYLKYGVDGLCSVWRGTASRTTWAR